MNKITIGIAQTPNSLELEKNSTSIFSLLSKFEQTTVDLILFSECSLSGFSAKMKECDLQTLMPYYEKIQNWVSQTGIEVIIPTAIVKAGKIYNSGWWFKTNEVITFYKIGLTDSEKKFFSIPEITGPKTFHIKGFNLSILICFEAEHSPWTYFQTGDSDAILWPGYWGWNLDSRWESDIEPGKPNKIFANVDQWKIPLLQSNFAYNDLENHKGAGPEGLSFIVDSNNKLAFKGPHKKVDGLLVTLLKKDEITSIFECKSLDDEL